jgi:hypothetical protein
MDMKQEQFTSLRSSTQEEYGQVQTLCDIIKAANEEKHFKSTQEVFEGISPIMARYIKRGTIGELTRQHIQAGLLNDESLFRDGQLDCDALRKKLLESITTDKDDKFESIMAQRDVFKFVGLLMYFNCFRKYTSVEQIREDFCQHLFNEEKTDGDLSKSWLNDKMFFCFPMGGHAYPYFSFFWALESLWKSVSDENGVLDNEKLQKKMIDEYQTCKKEMGLEALVDAHYSDDGPCHPEVFFPNTEDFYGPVLVAVENERKYIESCGEGKGPNRYPYRYEQALLQRIIDKRTED